MVKMSIFLKISSLLKNNHNLLFSIKSTLNENQGLLDLILFIITVVFGWVSGIFSGFIKKPKLGVKLLKGPTFACTFLVNGKKYNNYDVHKTGFALYLQIINKGLAPTSIVSINIGYHWNIERFSLLWLKYRIGWFWIEDISIALDDFQTYIRDRLKIYPFLIQQNSQIKNDTITYLQIGEMISGVVYFEQKESFGGCFPLPKTKKIKKGSKILEKVYVDIKLRIEDSRGKYHTSKQKIHMISLKEAKEYNPSFGETLQEIPKTENEDNIS